MRPDDFKHFRALLGKTQKQTAQLLGISIKAIHSYEQGWRTIPPHVERHMFFLAIHHKNGGPKSTPCWEIKNCPDQWKQICPAWEFSLCHLCWFVNGTVCGGEIKEKWRDKMEICRSCEVLRSAL
ncbi:Transcriptional regulator [Candidatus Desulfarcum epimagneticum]|uniref:Transcriptional regulator n=1 Tax=uncultured Desulfobacteraceae bacterium TaxID=218296 RepID=A0A484HJ73_9BACT|nr:Transcriptional regulator [uncultured Desulfobacteraceae bacterium]